MQIGISNYKESPNSGFSMVELAIVITIIGLLVAGVMSGTRLVQQSRLQNVIKEFQEYDTAVRSFRDKFSYYPGDFPKAATYWSTTSNGDGDWQVEGGADGAAPLEDLRAWSHLTLSGFLSGSYSGAVVTTVSTRYAPGANAPASKGIRSSGYEIIYMNNTPYQTKGTVIEFGSVTGSSSGHLDGQVLNAGDAYLIDKKMDDGKASEGGIYTARGNAYDSSSNCVSANAAAASATYTLTDTIISCRMLYWLEKNK